MHVGPAPVHDRVNCYCRKWKWVFINIFGITLMTSQFPELNKSQNTFCTLYYWAQHFLKCSKIWILFILLKGTKGAMLLPKNKPSFCSGSCNEIHARTKSQNKTSLKHSWNTVARSSIQIRSRSYQKEIRYTYMGDKKYIKYRSNTDQIYFHFISCNRDKFSFSCF